MTRSICPPSMCICGAANDEITLETPIQLLGVMEARRLSRTQVLEILRQSGVVFNPGNPEASLHNIPGLCRLTRAEIIKKLSILGNPAYDESQRFY